MRTVEQSQASLDSVLADVANGETVEITRDSEPIAHVVPVESKHDPERSRQAIESLRRLRRGNRLGGLKLKDLINEGRP